jgi:hypothetical protein
MSKLRTSSTPRFFDFGKKQADAELAINQAVAEDIQRLRREILDDRNVHRLQHGEGWALEHDTSIGHTTKFKVHSGEIEVPTYEIIDHRVDAIERYRRKLAELMHGQFMRSFYEVVGSATESSGNVVKTPKGTSFHETFKAGLRQIEFGTDRFGKPTMPQMHVSPAMRKEIAVAIAQRGDQVDVEVEELKALKEKRATIAEANRINRFRRI